MPRNIPLEGGKAIGEPADWNEAEHGPCSTINVLITDEPGALPRMTTAWRFSPAEVQALAGGGEAYLSIVTRTHPVISIWVQPFATRLLVGEGLAADPGAMAATAHPNAPTLLEHMLEAFQDDLDDQAEGANPADPEIGDMDGNGVVWMKGAINIRTALERAIATAAAIQANAPLNAKVGDKPRWGTDQPKATTEIPVMTLEAVAAEAQAHAALKDAGKGGGDGEP